MVDRGQRPGNRLGERLGRANGKHFWGDFSNQHQRRRHADDRTDICHRFFKFESDLERLFHAGTQRDADEDIDDGITDEDRRQQPAGMAHEFGDLAPAARHLLAHGTQSHTMNREKRRFGTREKRRHREQEHRGRDQRRR